MEQTDRNKHNNLSVNIEDSATVASSTLSPDNTTGSGENRQAEITLPVGGGAIRGIGEKFQANPVTGTASFSVPLTISEGRGGFTPQLALSYDSGSGNSVFGLGWSIGLPSITRKTDKGLPQYNDNANHESDVFILSGAEDLVPVLDNNGKQFSRTEDGYTIYSYQPRTEGLFALIERWVKDGISHWRTISKENITSVYGLTEKARIFDLDNERKIFSWLIEESWDAKGNLMKFTYKQENEENVPDTCYEKNRKSSFTNRYLEKVSYGNTEICTPSATASDYDDDFLFHLVFDYGEYADNTFTPNKTWEARSDAFSNYKACFEIRTHRLCRRVLMFHHFEDLGSEPVLVRSTDLKYDKTPAFTLLKSVTHTGYNESKEDSLPSLTFTYTQARIADIFREVPEDMLRQLPAGVDGQNYQWADLYSDGVSGILTMNNYAWYFKPNYGDRQYQSPPIEGCCCNNENETDRTKHTPFFGNMRSEVPRPAAANNQRTTFRLNDVDSDGYPELVIQGDGIHGYYTRDEDGKWLNFRNFQDNPNINYNDSNLRFVDLSGDGLADIVISKGETFDIYFSEGKKGFGNYRRVRCGHEYGNAPQVVFSDPKQRIFLADMSGDGLTDIVRITNQSIVYYPNMGYGRFGEQVVMSNPPLLDSLDQFDTRFVHLTDVDGTGTTDLLYISKGRIRYFKNLSGNRWEEEALPATIAANATQQNFIQTTDLLGNGTQCVVISSSLPAQAKKMRYWELTSGIKPFLLNEINNNMGGITRLHYAPSTKFYMQDKFNGTPWITKLPFPVQTLENVEIIDLVGNKHFTNRYAYHHGYWDPVEREFRGFGMVEQWDCEQFTINNEQLTIDNGELIMENETNNSQFSIFNSQLDTPPIYTKTWFHTGFFRSRDRISNLFWEEYFRDDGKAWFLPDTVLPSDLTGTEAREACRALRGSPLRIEVYAQDGTDKETIPYTVEEKNYKLQCLQEKGQNRHAVFLKTDAESLMYHYERQVDDPRILHRLVLGTDDFGNEKEAAEVAYPRRNPEFVEQKKILATYTANDFINVANIEENDYRLISIPYQTKQYEIHNLPLPEENELPFKIADLLKAVDNAKKIDYAEEPSTTDLQKRLFQHTKTLFWNEECTQSLPLSKIAPHALPYQQQSLELTEMLIKRYNSDGVGYITETLLTESGYLQDGSDWFAVSEIQHFDIGDFYLPDTITDPFSNVTTIEYDEYSLFPVEVSAPLDMVTSAEYDYRVLQPWKLIDQNGNSQEVEFDTLGMVTKLAIIGKDGEGDTLKEPTEKYSYNLHCWKNEQKPVYAHIEKRETHGVPDGKTRWLEAYVYTDGLGNEIMTKSTVADGLAWAIVNNKPTQDNTTHRWLASGKVIYNNKGLAVKQYEPWFSDTHEFTFEDALTHFGVTPIMYYDPLGRLIQTDFPDESTSRVEFNAWRQENYDQNDCDENSPHYKTPQVLDLDVLGRPFQATDDNGIFGESCVTHNQLDITGRITVVTDGLGRVATQNMYALSEEHLLTVDNIDSGKRWLLNNTVGKLVKKWDSRGYELTYSYDELQRLTDVTYPNPSRGGKLIERLVYGTDAQENNIGQVVKSYAQDGITSFEYDFKGNVIRQVKQFAEDYQNLLDWRRSVLLSETFKSETTYDALNRPYLIRHSDGQFLYYGYDKGGLLNFIQRNDTEVHVSEIEYNEKGQRLNIYYGNNTKTKYEYHEKNFRLLRILTTRNGGKDILQDLSYYFDKVGNIINIEDKAQQTHYFKNSVIAPRGTYTYDALYRLIEATGRELTNLIPTSDDFPNDIPVPNPDPNALQQYTHQYQYDALGNMLQMKSVGKWTRDNVYDTETNNYLLGHEGITNQYTYDAHGNMLTMPHLSSMAWDYKDQLTGATNGINGWQSYYNYDAGGNRTRKTVDKGNIIETRYYIGGYEVFRKVTNGTLDFERTTLNISDDEKVFVRVEEEKGKNEIVRYQFDNHLGSACLELDNKGYIISYEEYHPFGTTSYRAGRSETEVSLKRYKYCGKERDEETGLYYFGARFYAAWLCRWTACDPLQFETPEHSPFVYCSDNPVNMIDPDGCRGVRPSTRTNQRSPATPSRSGMNNYARNLQGGRLPSTGINKSTTTTYRRNNDMPYGLRTQVSEVRPEYISTYTTPYRNTIQYTKTNNSITRERMMTLVGDLANIKIDKIKEQINTPEGMKTSYTERVSFLDTRKEAQFNQLQNEYNTALQNIIAGITDESLNMEFNSYTPEWEKRFILDGMKAQQAKEILGDSPKEVLFQMLKQDYHIEKTTTTEQRYTIPEIRPVE